MANHSKPAWEPTQDELIEVRNAIRDGWTEKERKSREVCPQPEYVEIQRCHHQMVGQQDARR